MSEEAHTNPSDLATKEKQAASTISLYSGRGYLIAAWVLFVVGFLLPHAGSLRGWQVLIWRRTIDGVQIGITESVFVLLGTLAIVVSGGLLLITKRTVFANISFLLTGMAFFTSLFGMWMRLQDKENTGGPGLGVGFLLQVAAVVIATYALSCMIMRRSEAQKAIAKQRAENENLDEVGYAQRAALVSQQQNTPETNPLFIDDRRQRAAQRHRKQLGAGASGTPAAEN